jgi:hypothetical protein
VGKVHYKYFIKSNKEKREMKTRDGFSNRFIWQTVLFYGLLVISLIAFQPALALTDYIFFSVNGDTTGSSMTQGDFIGWGSNCDTGADVQFELWYDINHNDLIDTATDLSIVIFSAADGETSSNEGLPDINPVPDGWYITPEILAGFAPGMYVMRMMDLTDSTYADMAIVCYPMVSPPNAFFGHVTIAGYPAPNINLRNIWIQADIDEEGGMQMWCAMTDDNGAFQICVNDSGTGRQFRIEVIDIPGFVTPSPQTLTASGEIYGVDFDYTTPTDSLYGQIKDEEGSVITSPSRVYCNPMFGSA